MSWEEMRRAKVNEKIELKPNKLKEDNRKVPWRKEMTGNESSC